MKLRPKSPTLRPTGKAAAGLDSNRKYFLFTSLKVWSRRQPFSALATSLRLKSVLRRPPDLNLVSKLKSQFHYRPQMENKTAGGATESNGQTMTPVEEKKYGEMARKMQYFHDFFISEFNDIYDLADGGFNNAGMSLSMFLQTAKTFKKHLEGHHNIEERWIFPMLAKKMPAFRDDDRHQAQHKRIHHGLDELEVLVKRYSEDPSSYSPTELRACLDTFRETLMRHLNDEVHDLKAENLRKYWTLEELKAIPM